MVSILGMVSLFLNLDCMSTSQVLTKGTFQFRYADTLDKALILLGTVVALASAAIYPLMFLLYGSTATVFVDQAKNQTGGNFSW